MFGFFEINCSVFFSLLFSVCWAGGFWRVRQIPQQSFTGRVEKGGAPRDPNPEEVGGSKGGGPKGGG